MKSLKNFSCAIAALVVCLVSPGAEALDVSAVGALNLTNITSKSSAVSFGTTFGFGALAGYGVAPGFEAQLGALYMPRKIHVSGVVVSSSGVPFVGTVDETAKYFEIPLLVRFTALPIVSIGAGPYMAFGTGSIHVDSSVSGIASGDFSFADEGQSSTDFGLEASVDAKIPLAPALSLVGDARYVFGLSNADSTGVTSTHFRDIEVLVGVGLGL